MCSRKMPGGMVMPRNHFRHLSPYALTWAFAASTPTAILITRHHYGYWKSAVFFWKAGNSITRRFRTLATRIRWMCCAIQGTSSERLRDDSATRRRDIRQASGYRTDANYETGAPSDSDRQNLGTTEMLGIAATALLIAILVIRYGHIRFPCDQADGG